MTQKRYFRWMSAWKTISDSKGLPFGLYDLLNDLWQEERRNTASEILAAHAKAWMLANIDIPNEPDFQSFMRSLDGAFGKSLDDQK